MKRIVLPLLFGLALVAAGCESAEQRAVREVAQPYLDATANYRTEDAYPYASPEAQCVLRFMDEVLTPLADSAAIQANMPATVTIRKVRLTSDTTAVVSYHKRTPVKEYDSELNLRRRDGEWKVYMVLKQDVEQ